MFNIKYFKNFMNFNNYNKMNYLKSFINYKTHCGVSLSVITLFIIFNKPKPRPRPPNHSIILNNQSKYIIT